MEDHELPIRLRDFLSESMSLSEFVQWFNAALWAIDSDESEASSDIVDLAWTVQARLDESAAYTLSEAELRSALQSDLEVFDRHLTELDAPSIQSHTQEDIERFLSDEIGFNNQLGRAESALAALADRAVPSPNDRRVADLHRSLVAALTRIARDEVDIPATQKMLQQFRRSTSEAGWIPTGATSPTTSIELTMSPPMTYRRRSSGHAIRPLPDAQRTPRQVFVSAIGSD